VLLKEFGAALWGTNPVGTLKLVPITVGSNSVLAVVPDFHKTPLDPASLVVIKNYSPTEGILVAMKLALYGGLVLASPFVFLFIGQFVLPALKVKEKKLLYRAVGYGSFLFFLGVAFCYFIVAAVALGATVQFSQWLGFGADEWRADAYIGFMCKFMLGMGLGFELPVVILTLVKIGLLDYEKAEEFPRLRHCGQPGHRGVCHPLRRSHHHDGHGPAAAIAIRNQRVHRLDLGTQSPKARRPKCRPAGGVLKRCRGEARPRW